MFKNDFHKTCFERAVGFMKECFGEAVVVAETVPMMSIPAGSAIAFVLVGPLTENEAIVTVRAYVVSHASLSLDLAAFLLRANTTTMFGAFGLSPQGDIVLEHNLIGSTLSKEELRTSVVTIARVADEVDDEIVSRWGGKRALDRVDAFARLMDFDKPNARSH